MRINIFEKIAGKRILATYIVLAILVMLLPFNSLNVNANSEISTPDSVADIKNEEKVKAIVDKFNALGVKLDVPYSATEELSRGEFLNLVYPLYAFDGNLVSDKSSEVLFADVPRESPYWEAINWGYQLGFISMNEHALFHPDENITLEQAIKIVVSILGYRPLAESDGGYPSGYYKWAIKIDLLDGIAQNTNTTLTCYEAITMLDNAIEAEFLYQDSYGNTSGYEINQGYTYLSVIKKIYVTSGLVEANPYTSLYDVVGTSNDMIQVAGHLYWADDSLYDYVGMNVKLYYTEDDNGFIRALYAEPHKYTEIKELTPFDVQISENSIKYTENGKTKRISLKNNTVFIYNDCLAAVDLLPAINTCEEIKVINSDGSGAFDVVKIYDYTNHVVSSVSPSQMLIKLDGGKVSFDLSDNAISSFSVLHEDTEISLEDIKIKDVVSMYVQTLDGKKRIKMLVSREQRQGLVDSISEDYVTIGEQDFRVANDLQGNIKLGFDSTFYIDAFGRIAVVESYREMVYGYLYRYGSVGMSNIGVEIFTERSRWVELNLAKRVKYNGERVDREKVFNDPVWNKSSGEFRPQLVNYRVNEDNQICELNTAVVVSGDLWSNESLNYIMNDTFRLSQSYTSASPKDSYFDKNSKNSTVHYRTTGLSFENSFAMQDTGIVFSIPGNPFDSTIDEDEIIVQSVKELDSANYKHVYCYNMDEKATSPVVVIYGPTSAASDNREVCVVLDRFKAVGPDDEFYDAITGFYLGAELRILFESDEASGINYSEIEYGDVLQFIINSKGFATNVTKKNDIPLGSQMEGKLFTGKFLTASFLCGTVKDFDASAGRIVVSYKSGNTSDHMVLATSSNTIYTLITENSKEYSGKSVSAEEVLVGDSVFVRGNNSSATEIIIYRQ